MPYSLNKRKRWMLADDLRNVACACDLYEDMDYKVVLVERELTTNGGARGRNIPPPDCVRVCESKTDRPEVLPNQKYALVTDLRLKSKGLAGVNYKENAHEEDLPREEDPEEIEVYYEICYPRSEENSQWRKERRDAPIYRRGKQGELWGELLQISTVCFSTCSLMLKC